MEEFYDDNEKTSGQIQIADEVIAIIAGTAAYEVEGVVTASKISDSSFGGIFKKSNPSKGIKVNVDDRTVVIDAEIAVYYGINITETARRVQENIKSAVESMTGLSVIAVNVNISAVVSKEKTDKESE